MSDDALNAATPTAGRTASAFGALVVRLRSARGLGQEQLAERAGMSVRAIRDIERGRVRSPQRRSAQALATAFALDGAARAQFLREAAAGRTSRLGPAAGAPRSAAGSATAGSGGARGEPRVGPEHLWALPVGPTRLSGRDRELAELRAWAEEVTGQDHDAARPAASVHGQPGVGKTSLAVEAARALGARFPDGCLFLDLRGTDDRPPAPAEVLERLLRGLGVPESRLPSTVEERSSLLRVLLRRRRVLLVLDNVSDERQIRPVLPSGPPSAALITSRRALVGLDGVRHLSLDVLSGDGSLRLLRRIVGSDRVDAEPEAASLLARLCGHLPLALRIVGNRLAVRPRWSLAHLADRLADEERRLTVLSAGDLEVRAAFHLSYRPLAPDIRRVFRRLSLLAGAEFGVETGAALVDAAAEDVESVFEGLVDSGLLQTGREPGRYRLHDLLRLFARERLAAEEPAARVREAEDRLTRWLLTRATETGSLLDVERRVTHSEAQSAFQWLEREREHWIAAARTAAARGRHAELVPFARAMHWYSDGTVARVPWDELFGDGVAAARALGSEEDEVVLLNFLGWAQKTYGNLTDAQQTLAQAVALARRIGQPGEEAWARAYTARVLVVLGRPAEAVEHGVAARRLAAEVGLLTAEHYAAASQASALSALGRHEEALRLYRETGEDYRQTQGQLTQEHAATGEAFMLLRAAGSLAALGRWSEAVETLVRARKGIAMLRAYDEWGAEAAFDEGVARHHLGDADAVECFRDSLEVFIALGNPDGQARARAALARLGAPPRSPDEPPSGEPGR